MSHPSKLCLFECITLTLVLRRHSQQPQAQPYHTHAPESSMELQLPQQGMLPPQMLQQQAFEPPHSTGFFSDNRQASIAASLQHQERRGNQGQGMGTSAVGELNPPLFNPGEHLPQQECTHWQQQQQGHAQDRVCMGNRRGEAQYSSSKSHSLHTQTSPSLFGWLSGPPSF